MTKAEYLEFQDFLSKKTKVIFNVENANLQKKNQSEQVAYQERFSPDDCDKEYLTNEHVAYCAYTTTYKRIVDELYPSLHCDSHDVFETGNPRDILDALYDKDTLYCIDKVELYEDYLREESCVYVAIKCRDSFEDDILRLDLFRKIDADQFTGGLFHAMRHFSMNGRGLSTEKAKLEISSLSSLETMIINAFACKCPKQGRNWSSVAPYDDNHNLRVEFYYDDDKGAFYLNTAFVEGR